MLPSPTREPKLARAVLLLLLAKLWAETQAAEYLFDLAARQQISERTLKSAKELLGIETTRRGWGRGSRIWWRLPGTRAERLYGPPIGCNQGRRGQEAAPPVRGRPAD